MVRECNFLDLRPMTEAKALNLRLGRPSLGFALVEAADKFNLSVSEVRFEKERFVRRVEESLADLERDHHGLLVLKGGRVDDMGVGKQKSVESEAD